MSRVLHVIDQPGETAQALVLKLSVDAARYESDHPSNRHAWLLFGGEAMRDAARAIGLRDDQYRLHPRPTGLRRTLPQFLNKPSRWMQDAHRVVCWTEGAAQIASLMGCAHVVRRINESTRCPLAQSLITQAYANDAEQHVDREALRQRWGVDPDTTVIALLSDRIDQVDTGAAIMTLALTHEALRAANPEQSDVRLLCHPLAKSRAEAALLSELLHFDQLLIQDAQTITPWAVLHGCDVALAQSKDDAGLSSLWANAFGVPVVTPAAIDGAVPARSSKPSDLADALTKWVQSRVPA